VSQNDDLLISDIRPGSNNYEAGAQEMENFLKTGGFTKEMLMSSTMRDLSRTLKGATEEYQEEEFDQEEE